ncbi:MAG: T9SS type A sorting domain-containing protein [Bacteroidales bacterium]|nr:T9SS type A sorting domain-containing protein [Bacteroidales bacterium]
MIKPYSKYLFLLLLIVFFIAGHSHAQQLILMDVNDGNKVVNDGSITVSTNDLSTLELSAHLKIMNNTDKPIAMFMKKIINAMVDSTSNYFCLNPKCWPDADSTDIADSIQPGMCDSSFVTHYDHFFRYEKPIPTGYTSITYLFYDYTTFTQPLEARVTINYFVSGVGVDEAKKLEVMAYPSPAKDYIILDVSGSKNLENASISMFNLNGQLVKEFGRGILKDNLSLDVQDLLPGSYLARINREGEPSLKFKFLIINR